MQSFIEFLKTAQLPGARLVHHEFIPSRRAVYGNLHPPLAPPLSSALANLNISKLYSHQVESLTSFRQGENVVVATPTASGKSLIYNLALVELLSEKSAGHGLYLFPLKALAQDQYQAFVAINKALPEELQLQAAVYDGDTPPLRVKGAESKKNCPI